MRQLICPGLGMRAHKDHPFFTASLLENVTVTMRNFKVLAFVPDAFNALQFVEDTEKSPFVKGILCARQSCNRNQNTLEI